VSDATPDESAEQGDEEVRPPGLAIAGLATWLVGYASFFFFVLLLIPKFKEIFDNMGVAIPLLTRLILDLADWTTTYWFVAIPLWLAVGAASCAPFYGVSVRRLKAAPVAVGYFVGAFIVSLSIPLIVLPILEMQRALGK